MTEAELIEGCKKGKRRSQNLLYRKYFPLMSSLASRYSSPNEDTIEQLNIGFMKVLQNIHQYNSKHSLSTWIRNVLVHHLIDEYRKHQKEQHTYAKDPSLVTPPAAFNSASEKLEADYLIQMLDRLPPTTKHVFSLFAIDGFKHQEIAEMLNMSIGTSKWHVSQARSQLKEMLSRLRATENHQTIKEVK